MYNVFDRVAVKHAVSVRGSVLRADVTRTYRVTRTLSKRQIDAGLGNGAKRKRSLWRV